MSVRIGTALGTERKVRYPGHPKLRPPNCQSLDLDSREWHSNPRASMPTKLLSLPYLVLASLSKTQTTVT